MVQFGARWYDPATGRWLSKDPILLEGGFNLYVFCGNDPVNKFDALRHSRAYNQASTRKEDFIMDLLQPKADRGAS